MWPLVCGVLLAAAAAAADDNITVVRLQLALEEEHTLHVDNSLEYILQFVPTLEQSRFPSRVRVRSGGGDAARPLLVTARQRTGAITWQLPYYSGETLLYELERTLCPDDSADGDGDGDATDCTEEEAGGARRGEFSLHVGSACAAPFSVRLRAAPARDWRLPRGADADAGGAALAVSQAAPSVHYYRFPAGEDSVRLVLRSEDDVCATVAVQEYACPIIQTLEEMEGSTVRMTMQRSGGVQLSRYRYPRGFYVIGVTGDSDEECTGEPAPDPDWLWEAAVWPGGEGAGAREEAAAPQRLKHLTLHMKATLTRAQYLTGTLVSLAVFLLFYVALGALVLAERWPRWYRLVAPRAVLAKPAVVDLTQLESAPDTAAARRRRRDSDATFDSSDNSDSDSDDGSATVTTTAGAASTPAPHSPDAASPAPPTPGDASPEVAPGANGRVAVVELHEDAVTRADILERDEMRTAPSAAVGAGGVANGADAARIWTGADAAGDGTGAGAAEGGTGAGAAEGATGVDAAGAGVGASVAGTGAGAGAAERPFGLPARLHVAALARRRDRVLRARSDRYLYTLYTVAVFYALPVVQFVAAFQMFLNVSGSLDLCYYNFLCAHPLGALSDFNHVFSNLGYLLLGALFLLQLRRRRMRRKRHPRDEEYGIPQHYGLLSSLGAGMMVVALLSASYHVCPNRLNFQFDTAFMYVLAVLCTVKVYQARHPDINARAHATFGVLAALIALVVWGVLGGGPLFWSVFTVVHVFTFLLLSLRIYYVGQFRLEKESLAETARSLRAGSSRPLYTARLVALVIANAVNWGFALYGLVRQTADIASHLLGVLLCNALLYIVFYLCMKALHGERVRWYARAHVCGGAAAWAAALYFFTAGSTDWARTPAQSRHANHECRVLAFYDSHDLWHVLSAVALYLTFNALLTWDDGLSAVRRTEIAVF